MDNFNFNFNTENFGLGLLAGWASAYALYRARGSLGRVRQSLTEQASSAQNYALRTTDSRYINDLTRFCEHNHIAGRAIELSKILVEPRFIAPPPPAAPEEDDVNYDVFRVVPRVHDHPYLHAPYNIETMSIADLGNGARALALLGLPGSGRTTALQAMALWSLGKVEFKPLLDAIQQQIEEEEAALSKDDRAQRVKERLQIEERARERLAKERGQGGDADARPEEIPVFKQLMPVYINLANVRLDTGEYGRRIDPAEPLVRAVQFQVGRITAKSVPRAIYEKLDEGRALLMIDGFDELPEAEQGPVLGWLQALLEQYSDNFIIVTGSATGYGGLQRAGFMPVFIRPWNDVAIATTGVLWSQNWSQIKGGRRRAAVPDEYVLSEIQEDSRGWTPLEYTLKLWATLDNPEHRNPESWLRFWLEFAMPEKQALGSVLSRLSKAAVLQLDEGYVTAQRLDEVMTGMPPAASPFVEPEPEPEPAPLEAADDDVFAGVDDDDLDSLFDDDAAPTASESPEAAPEPAAATAAEPAAKPTRTLKEQARFLADLAKSGLMTVHRGGRYRFRHAQFAAYLASLTLRAASEDKLFEAATNPRWASALAYSAMHSRIDSIVAAYLESPDDVLHNNLLTVSRWLAYAESRSEWRPAVLKKLGNVLVAPNQFPLTRERIAAALVGTRDRSVMKIFNVAVRHPNADVRRLGCLGLGAFQLNVAIPDIVGLLQDTAADVQLSAGLALGAIGSEAALDEMVVGLTEGSEQVRQAIAEAFAAIPDEGYPTLRDAAQATDMMLRRAAMFGLRRINATWALVSLYRASIEDDQWYVRSAAEQAFHEMRFGEKVSGVRRYPKVDSLPWLMEWVAGLEPNTLKEDQDAEEILLMALERGDPETQLLSVTSMGQLGLVDHVGTLYTALRHRQAAIRDAAYRALADLQSQLGYPLPSPV